MKGMMTWLLGGLFWIALSAWLARQAWSWTLGRSHFWTPVHEAGALLALILAFMWWMALWPDAKAGYGKWTLGRDHR